MNDWTLRIAAFLLLALVGSAAWGQQVTTTSSDTPEYVVMEIQMLLEPDTTIQDPAKQSAALARKARQVPALADEFARRWPASPYRPMVESLRIDALTAMQSAGDPAGSDKAIVAAAKTLQALPAQPDFHAKAKYVLLNLALKQTLAARTATQPASRSAVLTDFAGRFLALAGAYPGTSYGALAMYHAGLTYIGAGRADLAVPALEKLSKAYPKDSLSYNALLLLVGLHTNASEPKKALAVKRQLVGQFPDSPAALAFRCDIAQSECIGKQFFLRFTALDGRRFEIRKHRGKMVWVYFFLSAASDKLAKSVAADLAGLKALAGKRAVVVAIGADPIQAGPEVQALLKTHGVSCPVLLDSEGQVASQYGVMISPSVAVVDASGRLSAIVAGPRLLAKVKGLVTVAPGELPATRPATQPAESAKPAQRAGSR